jgi:hypothetical protein
MGKVLIAEFTKQEAVGLMLLELFLSANVRRGSAALEGREATPSL